MRKWNGTKEIKTKICIEKKYSICCDIIGHIKYANTMPKNAHTQTHTVREKDRKKETQYSSKVREAQWNKKTTFNPSIHLILFVDANGNENKLCKNDMCTGNQQIMRSDSTEKEHKRKSNYMYKVEQNTKDNNSICIPMITHFRR